MKKFLVIITIATLVFPQVLMAESSSSNFKIFNGQINSSGGSSSSTIYSTNSSTGEKSGSASSSSFGLQSSSPVSNSAAESEEDEDTGGSSSSNNNSNDESNDDDSESEDSNEGEDEGENEGEDENESEDNNEEEDENENEDSEEDEEEDENENEDNNEGENENDSDNEEDSENSNSDESEDDSNDGDDSVTTKGGSSNSGGVISKLFNKKEESTQQDVVNLDAPDEDAVEIEVTEADLEIENSLFTKEKDTSFNIFGMTKTRSITSGKKVVITGKIKGQQLGCRLIYSEEEALGAKIKDEGPVGCSADIYLDNTGTYVLETTTLPLGLNKIEVFTKKEKAIFNVTVIDAGIPSLIELADISFAGNTDLEKVATNHYKFTKKIKIKNADELELIASIKNAHIGEQFYVNSIWRSLITSSTILTDKGTEIIVVKPPKLIEEGQHAIYLKTVNPDAFISSDTVRVDYDLKYEKSIFDPKGPTAKGLILVLVVSSFLGLRARKIMSIQLSDSSNTEN